MTSTPGKGTQVRVILPLPEADPASITRPEPDEVPDLTLLEGRSLLVADDNVTNRLVLSEMLGQTGGQGDLGGKWTGSDFRMGQGTFDGRAV